MSAPVDHIRPPDEQPRGWRERARVSTLAAVGPPDMVGLSSTLRRGALYSAAALVFGQVISFAQTLVLARLLSPAELGVYVTGTILSGFLISAAEGGLRGALIQRENDVHQAADTVFWVTGGTGLLLAFAAVGTAPLIGAFFDDPTAMYIAAANAGTLLIHGLTNVPDGLMQRQFNFRRRLIVDPARMLVFAVVTITFAALGYGAWSQVIGNYSAMLTWLVLSWWFAGWWPGFAKPSYALWREMAKFAFPLLMESIVEKLRNAAETALIGRGLSTDAVGQYRYGQRLSLIPGTAVVQIGSYVLFPAFSRLAGDPDRLRNAFLRGAQWSWIASAAVAGLVIAIGQPAVVVLLGAQWRDAGLAFVALSGYGLGIALQAAGSEAIKATGRSQLLNWTTATSIILGIGLLIVLMPPLGLVGVGLAVSVTELAIGAVVLVLTHKVVPYSVPVMTRMLLPPLLVAAVAAAGVGYLEHQIVHSDLLSPLLGVLGLAAESALFMVLFLLGMAAVEPRLARRAVKAVRSKLRRGGDTDDGSDDEDDGIERRDPQLDPPTMMIPVFAVDETMEFGRRPSRQFVSPTAQTMLLPVVRPAGRPDRAARPAPGADIGASATTQVVNAEAAGERPRPTPRPSTPPPPAPPTPQPVEETTRVAIPARQDAPRPSPGPAGPGPFGPTGPGYDGRPPFQGGAGPNGAGPNGAGPNGAGPNGAGPSGPGPPGPGPNGPWAPGRGPRPSTGPERHVPPPGQPRRQVPPNGGRGPRPPTPPAGLDLPPVPRPHLLQGPSVDGAPPRRGPAPNPGAPRPPAPNSPAPNSPAPNSPAPNSPAPNSRAQTSRPPSPAPRHRYVENGETTVQPDEATIDDRATGGRHRSGGSHTADVARDGETRELPHEGRAAGGADRAADDETRAAPRNPTPRRHRYLDDEA